MLRPAGRAGAFVILEELCRLHRVDCRSFPGTLSPSGITACQLSAWVCEKFLHRLFTALSTTLESLLTPHSAHLAGPDQHTNPQHTVPVLGHLPPPRRKSQRNFPLARSENPLFHGRQGLKRGFSTQHLPKCLFPVKRNSLRPKRTGHLTHKRFTGTVGSWPAQLIHKVIHRAPSLLGTPFYGTPHLGRRSLVCSLDTRIPQQGG